MFWNLETRARKLNLITALFLGGASGGIALWLGGEALAVLVRRVFGSTMPASDFLTWLVVQRVWLGALLGSILAALAFPRRRIGSRSLLLLGIICSVLTNVLVVVPIFRVVAAWIFGD